MQILSIKMKGLELKKTKTDKKGEAEEQKKKRFERKCKGARASRHTIE